MKGSALKHAIPLFVLLAALAFSLAHCGTRQTASSGSLSSAPLAPQLVQVSNASSVGFYTSTGGFGFKTEAASVLEFPATVSTTALDLSSTLGALYFGTSSCTTSCNNVYYVNPSTGQFLLGGLAGSTFALTPSGTSTGGAVNSTLKYLYIADGVSQEVVFLKAQSLGYAFGSLSSSSFSSPTGHTSNALVVDPVTNVLLVTDTLAGSVYFLNASNGALITTTSGQVIPITNVSAGCTSGSQIGAAKFNSDLGYGYVLCGSTLTYFSMLAAPKPITGSVSTSMFNTTGVTSPTDFVYDNIEKKVYVVGGSTMVSLDSASGALGTSLDLTTLGCGTSLSLSAITFASTQKTLYVADQANSLIYALDSATLALKSGTCANSTFSTGVDVPQPTHLGFF